MSGRLLSSGLVLAGLWLLLSGHFEAWFLVLGVVSVLLAAAIARRMDVIDHEGHPLHLGRRIAAYIPWLLWEIVKANIDVAKLVLNPRLPISPTVIRVRASQRTELGQVIYANSITLTPGTVTIGLENGEVAVHAITAAAAEGVESGDMDRRVTALESAG
jgi:multicomponent Na+:H+ antiporter subunit E